jgi:hypothetical protein
MSDQVTGDPCADAASSLGAFPSRYIEPLKLSVGVLGAPSVSVEPAGQTVVPSRLACGALNAPTVTAQQVPVNSRVDTSHLASGLLQIPTIIVQASGQTVVPSRLACGLLRLPTITGGGGGGGSGIPGRAGALPTVLPGNAVILYQDQTFTGDAERISLDVNHNGVNMTSAKLKVIRRCTFRDMTISAIVLRRLENLLIEDCVFKNIRTYTPDVGVSAIAIFGGGGDSTGLANNVTIRRCYGDPTTTGGDNMASIGGVSADWIQAAGGGRLVTNLRIEYNDWFGPGQLHKWGENGIDIKGADGPVTIYRNWIKGWYSNDGGPTQDASGSLGTGMVIHDSGCCGNARDVLVLENLIEENEVYGLTLNGVDGACVMGNTFRNNGTNHWRAVGGTPGVTACKYDNLNTYFGTGTVVTGPCTNGTCPF